MKKNQRTLFYISTFYLLAIFLYVFIYFIIPFKKVSITWISFAFTMESLLFSYLTSIISFNNRDLKSKLYGLPIFKIGILYVFFEIITSLIFIILGITIEIQNWICWLIEVIAFIIAFAGVFLTESVRKNIDQIETDTKINLNLMNKLKSESMLLAYIDTNGNLTKEIEKLLDDIKYSDPVSNQETIQLENELIDNIEKLKYLLQNAYYKDARIQINIISRELKERNNICKLKKGE